MNEVFSIDIETSNGRPEDQEADVRRAVSEQLRIDSRWKDETATVRIRERIAKTTEKLALMDSAPIAAVGFATPQQTFVFHGVRPEPVRMLPEGVAVQGFGTERDLLLAARAWLDSPTYTLPESVVVGHNIKHFDLPKLRGRYAVQKLKLPRCLADPNQATFDTLKEFWRRFTVDAGDVMVSLAEVCERFGIQHHKQTIEGSQIPELIAAGQVEILVRYLALDVQTELRLARVMQGEGDGFD